MLEKLFGRGLQQLGNKEYIELDPGAADTPSGKVALKVEKLEDFADTDRILKAVRDGSIVLVKIRALRDKDMSELKRAVDKFRKTALAINGDIAGIEEDWVVITPSFAHVARA
jgi:SepF-like predicted cell division protein (DUF552 family)